MNPYATADGWEQALARAGRIGAAGQPPALCTELHWDYVGIRGVLAVVLQALAQQTGRAPENVPLEELQQHCERGPGHIRDLAVTLVGEDLAYSLDTRPEAPVPAAGDPPGAMWLWLTRLWPPEPPDDVDDLPPSRPRPRWDGMSRGIARGNPGAAVDLLALAAADAAAAAAMDAA
ncbi:MULTISPECIES: hypothetical protein [unclassified Streptomyces]|uniref:hypothetical protein n=1 Tax=unclassified Streptomyces TaxID=2593676 RepID=UPI002366393F|nr:MULTISPECIES: hypothetical protein [unclassified Streptomyces]MDF3142146.1 hypothetical protein [Streptomyces sp. T21Q-yed]WDF43573.1 hypothetical protein PBV52_45755 [Streptomyces sp. T12]